jgi:hypothetical protein
MKKLIKSPVKTEKFIEKRYKSQLESNLSTTFLGLLRPFPEAIGPLRRAKKQSQQSGFCARFGIFFCDQSPRSRRFLALQLAGFSC